MPDIRRIGYDHIDIDEFRKAHAETERKRAAHQADHPLDKWLDEHLFGTAAVPRKMSPTDGTMHPLDAMKFTRPDACDGNLCDECEPRRPLTN